MVPRWVGQGSGSTWFSVEAVMAVPGPAHDDPARLEAAWAALNQALLGSPRRCPAWRALTRRGAVRCWVEAAPPRPGVRTASLALAFDVSGVGAGRLRAAVQALVQAAAAALADAPALEDYARAARAGRPRLRVVAPALEPLYGGPLSLSRDGPGLARSSS